MDDKESFLSRWSRRKLETKKDESAGATKAAESASVAVAAPRAPAPPAPELPKPGTPEYREFFDPQVAESLRHLALKKLFNDPQFNVMDGLDTYIDDYTKPDPIPEAMLRGLNQAKELFLFDDEDKPAGGASDGAMAAGEPAPASRADMNALENPATAGVARADVAPGSAATSPPDERRND